MLLFFFSNIPNSTELTEMTEKTSPGHLSPDHHLHVTPTSSNPSQSACMSSTLPPALASSTPPQFTHSSATLATSPLRPSTKPLQSPAGLPAPSSVSVLTPNTSAPLSASVFTPICPASPQSSSHQMPSTPPSSPQPPPRRPPLMSSNHLSVSSSNNSLDGEVQVSDIYFVSTKGTHRRPKSV